MWRKLVLIIGYLANLGLANQLNFKPIVNLTKTDYWISFEESGINSVLFYAEMNKICPGKYVYAFDSSLSHPWVMQDHLNSNLRENNMHLHALVVDSFNKMYFQSFNITMNPSTTTSTITNNKIQNVNNQERKPRVINPMTDCIPTETKMSRGSPICSGELIFKAYFENGIDYSIWSPNNKKDRANEVVSYKNHSSTAFIKQNRLHLRVNRAPKGDLQNTNLSRSAFLRWASAPGYDATKLETRNTFSFKYGRVDIRAKIPIGDWLLPIIELTSKYNEKLSIRVAYARGNENLRSTENTEIGGKRLYGGVRNEEKIYYVDIMSSEHYGRQFNTYSVIWHSDRIIYKVNDITYGILTDATILSMLQEHECFIKLGITVGGQTDFYHQTIHRDYHNGTYINFDYFKAAVIFKEQKISWKQQELVVESIKVYSTDNLDE